MANVTLRKVKLSSGRFGLYADIYPPPAKKSRMLSLDMRIIAKPKTAIERQHNKSQLAVAEQICQRKANELSKPEVYSQSELKALRISEKQNQSFVAFCKQRIAKIEGDSYKVYQNAMKYFLRFIGEDDIKCGAIDLLLIEEFADSLPSAKKFRGEGIISQNSAATYFGAFKGLLIDAYKAELLVNDFGRMVDGLPPKEGNREFLTIEEVRMLAKTESSYPGLKEMALFSALTGMRFSDIAKMERSEIKLGPDGRFLDFTQKKTRYNSIIPISDQAFDLIPPAEKIPFGKVNYQNMQRPFTKWISDAGIQKKITFHCLRHTFATLQIDGGTDLLTVSKMMGHKNIRSTQIYTKIMDAKKVEAANKILI